MKTNFIVASKDIFNNLTKSFSKHISIIKCLPCQQGRQQHLLENFWSTTTFPPLIPNLEAIQGRNGTIIDLPMKSEHSKEYYKSPLKNMYDDPQSSEQCNGLESESTEMDTNEKIMFYSNNELIELPKYKII